MQRIQVDDIMMDTLPLLLRMEKIARRWRSPSRHGCPLLDHRSWVRHLTTGPPEGAGWVEQVRDPRSERDVIPEPRAAAHQQTRLRRAGPSLAGARSRPQVRADHRFVALRALHRRRGAARLGMGRLRLPTRLKKPISACFGVPRPGMMWMRAFDVS